MNPDLVLLLYSRGVAALDGQELTARAHVVGNRRWFDPALTMDLSIT